MPWRASWQLLWMPAKGEEGAGRAVLRKSTKTRSSRLGPLSLLPPLVTAPISTLSILLVPAASIHITALSLCLLGYRLCMLCRALSSTTPGLHHIQSACPRPPLHQSSRVSLGLHLHTICYSIYVCLCGRSSAGVKISTFAVPLALFPTLHLSASPCYHHLPASRSHPCVIYLLRVLPSPILCLRLALFRVFSFFDYGTSSPFLFLPIPGSDLAVDGRGGRDREGRVACCSESTRPLSHQFFCGSLFPDIILPSPSSSVSIPIPFTPCLPTHLPSHASVGTPVLHPPIPPTNFSFVSCPLFPFPDPRFSPLTPMTRNIDITTSVRI
ncbi:hypothetical protein BD413DRAFT_27565 [Trametes elegans]|nr:hypothetical protein BD413DRAFT_27565 [Trametes elegans]